MRIFYPGLDVFVIATTLAEDTAFHKAATALNASKKHPFKISYWGWSHFNDKLNRCSKLMEDSYRNYAKYFDVNEHLLELEAISEGFSRPAFIDDFLQALGDTRLFLQTGLLRDRTTGELRRGAYPLSMLPSGECKRLRKRFPDDVNELRKQALKDNSSGDLNRYKAKQYNASRYTLISEVNKALVASGMPKIVLYYKG